MHPTSGALSTFRKLLSILNGLGNLWETERRPHLHHAGPSLAVAAAGMSLAQRRVVGRGGAWAQQVGAGGSRGESGPL